MSDTTILVMAAIATGSAAFNVGECAVHPGAAYKQPSRFCRWIGTYTCTCWVVESGNALHDLKRAVNVVTDGCLLPPQRAKGKSCAAANSSQCGRGPRPTH